MGRTPASRRETRSWRITAAVILLAAASVLVLGAVAIGDSFVVGVAGVLTVAAAWTALRLAWSAVVTSRFEHAVDRTELAFAYRSLFAERAVETATFVSTMTNRTAQRERELHELQATVASIGMRAVEAEASARSAHRTLSETTYQLSAMERLITAQVTWQERQEARVPRTTPSRPPLGGSHARAAEGQRPPPTPEWAHLEPDPIEALMAWEQHAVQVSQARHAARDRRSGGA